MKKVASIVLNNFKNDSRVLKENISLQNAGYEVKVIALCDEGQEEFEKVNGISVHRIKLKSRNWSKNKVIQILKYFEFIYRVIKQYKNNDIFHCNDLNTLPIGVIIKKIFNKNVKIVYDAHEHETEMSGLKGLQKKIVKFLEKTLIRYPDKIITVSEPIAEDYRKMYFIEKPVIIYNTPNHKIVKPNDYFREHFNIPKGNYIYLFQGGLFKGRGIENIMESFKESLNRNIVFMGYGNLVPLIKEYELKYNNIFYHESVPSSNVLDYTVSADFGINAIIDEGSCKSYDYSLPNKLFEYLMAGLPVIVTLPEMSRFVSKYKIGVRVESKSNIDLSIALDEIEKKDLRKIKNQIQEVMKYYCWEEQELKLIKVYKSLYSKVNNSYSLDLNKSE